MANFMQTREQKYQPTGQKMVALGGVNKLGLPISETQTGYKMGGLSKLENTEGY